MALTKDGNVQKMYGSVLQGLRNLIIGKDARIVQSTTRWSLKGFGIRHSGERTILTISKKEDCNDRN